ncbi:hypothetical protein SADO_02310 [Salinisphaera dokdonensis CL-ES53]|uniref:Yip1 domain-containing protein n=1 Tax=Salinisphaera dokdonensis CL-ES53 TaxID=1304272 RepID=A0ABV2AWM2_9GAMM
MVIRSLALPRYIAGAGILGLALVWSLANAWRHADVIQAADVSLAQALLLVSVGGTLTVCGVWVGVGAVTWTMARAVGARIRFRAALLAVSAATPPLWLALPATLIATDQNSVLAQRLPAALLALVCAGVFLRLLVNTLHAASDFQSWQRVWGCVALAGLFCVSFLSLSLF